MLLALNAYEFGTDEKLSEKAIYPKIRTTTSPSAGQEPAFNSPSFQWPSVKKAKYSVRISASHDFSKNPIVKNEIPYAIFNPHKILDEGKWYWQYKTEDGKWNPVDSFQIKPATPVFNTPEIKKVLQSVSAEHPRVLVTKAGLNAFRARAKQYRESEIIIEEANSYLGKNPPSAESLLPTFEGKNDFENKKIALLSSKTVGWEIYNALIVLSQAYVLTGNKSYFETAKK